MPLEEVELRAPRLKAPAAFGDLFTDDQLRAGLRTRSARPTATSCGGSGGSSRTRRTSSRCPRDESEIEAVLSWAEAEGAAVIPFGGGTSVVGGVEARLGERPVVSLDLRRLDRVLEVDAESLAARIQAGRHRPAARGAAARARADAAPLPAVVRVLDPGRLDRDPGRRPLRHPLHPHRRPGRVGAGDHAARDLGEPAAAGLGGRALAGPGADRLRGDPRRDRRGLGAGAAAAAIQGLLRGRVRRLPRRGAAPCARSPSRASTRPTAACSTRWRRARPAPATGETNLLVLGFESAAPPGRRADGLGARDRPRARRRRRARSAAGGGEGGADAARRRLAQRLPAGALPARHLRRLRRPLRDLRDGDHLGPLRGLPRDGDGGGAARRSPRSATRPPRARARRGSAAASPTSTPTGRRPTSRCSPRRVRGGEVEQWDEIKAAAAEARDRGAAARSPTTTRSAATTAPGTTASARPPSPPRCAPPRPSSTRPGCSTPAS